MRRKTVKKHIDKKILERLGQVDFDTVRQELHKKIHTFREKIYNMVEDQNYIVSEDLVETLNTEKHGSNATKARYFSYYVLESEKRLIDLYTIERNYKYHFGFSDQKTFKLLLFKERLETPKESIVSKHWTAGMSNDDYHD